MWICKGNNSCRKLNVLNAEKYLQLMKVDMPPLSAKLRMQSSIRNYANVLLSWKIKNDELSLIRTQAVADKDKSVFELNKEIESLKSKLETQGKDFELDKERSLNALKQENEQLKAKIENNAQERTLAVTTALSEKKDEIVEKEKQILLLETKLQDAEKISCCKSKA